MWFSVGLLEPPPPLLKIKFEILHLPAYTSRKSIIWSPCGDGGKKYSLEEQQNVIYFILENEGDYEGYFCKL